MNIKKKKKKGIILKYKLGIINISLTNYLFKLN